MPALLQLSPPSPGILTGVVVAGVGLFLNWFRKALRAPPHKICGSPNGPPITVPRVRLKDGRYLAYKETGVPRRSAKYKSIFVHGFRGSRLSIPEFSQDLIQEHSIYIVSFDRPGYGESDPDQTWQIRRVAHDIEQLADLLQLGDKFYLIVESIGAYCGWGCLKYIPHRLLGVGMIVPVTNYWWRCFNPQEFKQAFEIQVLADRLFLRVMHHLPWLAYFWMTQPWLPAGTAASGRTDVLSRSDQELIQSSSEEPGPQKTEEGTKQGIAESLCRDVVVMFGNWEFDPTDLQDPFRDRPGSVHVWQGAEDYLVPTTLQRIIHQKLPWIHYHELEGKGHQLNRHEGFSDSVLKTLFLGESFDH